ncbi:aminotransferase-like domain-containing protein [Geopseudomonas guangdongensis]|uniref:Transcriptional regulator, GntR family n=1 Tax=Geopseudomonas guangdongensis TaxID=1245526 RepID=A0A1H2ERW5_9GAMM|nr:PLP-dependent aminotransferase family protein [Pseudomonas guangdongensis]SDT97831.1 transcriptional regulator, GntR family [Pseudomonas guangdongensis]
MNAPVRYRQLAAELAEAIDRGSLPAGARLPSVRACAAQHALSLNTVTAAYRLLEDRGLIEARPQSGYYVRSSLPALQRPLRARPSGVRASGELDELMSVVLQCQQREDHVDLALACPRGEMFYPGAKLARLTAALLRRQPQLVGRYALPPGSLRLRTQIARRAKLLGMDLAADDILLTHGAMEALQLALRAVTRAGDTVGIESPSYFNLYPLLASLGLRALEIPTHPQHGLALDALELLLEEKRLQAIVAMPTVHNPLGCSMPLAAKRRLAELVNRHRVPLIEDALYAELQFVEPLQPTVKAFDSEGWVMVCASYTKTLAPDYRIGWLEAGRFAETVRKLKFSSTVAESLLLGETVGAFLESGGYDHHMRALRRRYAAQVDAVRGLIARHFPAGTRATQPAGGFLLWLELPASVDSLALFHAALAERIVIIPGLLYSTGARYRHCLRLSCCYPLDERAGAALRRLGELACALAGSGAAD